MKVRMQQRRGTAAQWAAANPVLSAGEIGHDLTNDIFKMGDGVSTWLQLPARFPTFDITVENRTGVVSYSASSHAWIKGMVIAVPPTIKDVTINWFAATGISIAGEGVISTYLYELTGGGAVIRGNCTPQRYESNVIATQQGPTHEGFSDVGASAITRIFALYLGSYSATGSALQSYVWNGDTDYNRTLLKARA